MSARLEDTGGHVTRYVQNHESELKYTIVIKAAQLNEVSRKLTQMSKKMSVQINKVLKQLMGVKGINAKELAKLSAIPQSTLSSYLSGVKASYEPNHLYNLSTVFDVSIEFLLFGKERDAGAILNGLTTEQIFTGFLKVKIERVIPDNGNKGDSHG